jgi:Rrf2 family protein
MKISAKCDYALRAMLELALRYEKGASNIHEIAQKQNIPKRYLEHLLLSLKKYGLVVSYRGKEGGYKLAKRSKSIKVFDIIRAIEGLFDICPKGRAIQRKDAVSDVWVSIQSAVENVLDSITLEDLAAKKQRVEKTLTYNI